MTSETVEALLARHERVPARSGAAAQVLRLVDDPAASAHDLARALGTDPVLAARVLRVANSSYYGLSGRISTLPFAVSVVGFQAVRSLAVVVAAGLDDADGVPAGFWRGAALTATAAELVAPLLQAEAGDAFSLGLLHTLGAALLHQEAPLPALCLPEGDDEHLLQVERDTYGISHDELGSRVLRAWHVPERLCDLVATHHQVPGPDAEPLVRTLQVARRLADHLLRAADGPVPGPDLAWLTQGRVGGMQTADLLTCTADRAERLLEGLRDRG